MSVSVAEHAEGPNRAKLQRHHHQARSRVADSTLTVATYNIRNTTDRYSERKPLLVNEFLNFKADVVALQEVSFVPELHQGDLLANSGDAEEGEEWECFEARLVEPFTSVPGTDSDFRIDGNAIILRTGCCKGVRETEVLHFNECRAVQRLTIELPSGLKIWILNTHFHHVQDADGDDERFDQAERLVRWCDDADQRGIDHIILLGDFNCRPFTSCYEQFLKGGFRSVHFQVTGMEPTRTFPSGLKAPFMDRDPPMTTDYIFHRGSSYLKPVSVRIAADRPHENDETLYASDHFAVVATFEICFEN